MIQDPPSLSLVRHVIRETVCRQCSARPAGSESMGPDEPRTCEATCPVFARLPRLRRVAEQIDPMLRSRAAVLEKDIRWDCRERDGSRRSASASLNAEQRCLLSRNAKAVSCAVASLYGL